MTIPSKRAYAIRDNAPEYFTGKACKKGHIAKRRTSNGHCVECDKIHYKNNRSDRLEYETEYRKANPEKRALAKVIWIRENRPYWNSLKAKRRASLANRTPAWLTKSQHEQITEFYEEAVRMSEITGIPHHVDHVIPLNGTNVSGLHVPNNLQVIPASTNLSKSNTYAV